MEHLINIISQYLENGNLAVFFVVYFVGLLTSFTPCVYPVLPLTVAYFGSQTGGVQRRIFLHATCYVLGMSLIYSVLGMIAALTGSLFGKIAVHPITQLVFANICILLGLSMLDVFSLSLPISFSQATSRKGFIGSFFVGCSAGLVMGPCTTPVLGLLLAYVGTKQKIFLGGSLLFVFSLGLGTFLFLLGIFSGLIYKLPKSGQWMVWIKKIFGLTMIALGEYFIFRAGEVGF